MAVWVDRCCCLSLRTGTILIATFSTLVHVAIFVVFTVLTEETGIILDNITDCRSAESFLAIICGVAILIYALLIKGILEERPNLLLPWFIYHSLLLLTFWRFILSNIQDSTMDSIEITGLVSLNGIYFLIVVWNQYQALRHGKQHQYESKEKQDEEKATIIN